MVGDMTKFFGLTVVLVVCVLATDAGPCFSFTREPAPVIVLAAGPEKHAIAAGDTINSLAQRYGVPASAILKANPGLNPARLQLGKAIVIPEGGKTAEAAPVPLPEPQNLELLPEEAPQATPPIPHLREHDLPDARAAAKPQQAAVPPKPQQAAVPPKTSPTPPAPSKTAVPIAASVPAPAAKEKNTPETVEKAFEALKDHAEADVPVGVEKVGNRTRFAIGGKAFFADQIVPWVLSLGSRLLSALLLFVVGIWISRRLSALLVRLLSARQVPSEILSFAGSLVRYGLYLVVAIATLGQLGLNVSSLLALFGAAGLAVSLALKDTLSNFASGVMLLLFRFFRVGDRVSVPGAAGAAGIVTALDVFNTVIRSDTGEVIIVPNSKIAGNVIVVSAAPGEADKEGSRPA